MELAVFESLAQKVEELLSRLRTLKEENQTLSQTLTQKEARLDHLEREFASAQEANSEARGRLEDLLKRIDEEIGQE
ncbi:MAG: cell division protein ZapB [Deltaproteobacteria bacterium]|nr:cell division protein ZapB [Deltaproteobacteria bacterium]